MSVDSEGKQRKRPKQQITVNYSEEFIEDEQAFNRGFELLTKFIVQQELKRIREERESTSTDKTDKQ